jgi:hypothetical protein
MMKTGKRTANIANLLRAAKMNSLKQHIENNFANNISAFSDFAGVSNIETSKMIEKGCIVFHDKIFEPTLKMPEITIIANAVDQTLNFPLYKSHHSLADTNHSAFITLNPRNGDVYAMAGEEKYSDIIYFKITPILSRDSVNRLIDKYSPLFQAIVSGTQCTGDRNSLTPFSFTEHAAQCIETLEEELREVEEESLAILDNFDFYLEDDPFGIKINAKGFEDIETSLAKRVSSDGYFLSDDLERNKLGAICDFYEYLESQMSDEDYENRPDWVKTRECE